jgi:hypothetical protein
MHEFYFLCRQFRWELAYRIVSALLATFLGLLLFGMVLADNLPDWIRSVSWLQSFAAAMRELPPWDFILIAFAVTLIGGYLLRVTTYLFRKRNTSRLGKITLKELNEGLDGLAIQQRRRHMFGRSRLLSMVFEMGSAVSAVFGVVCALIVFGYYPSAIVLVVLVLVTVFYLPTAVKRWLAGLEKNEQDHEALRNKLKDAGSDSDSVEIHVHAERIRIRAKNPILRFSVIWPLLVIVVPGTIGAAAMESWLFAVNINDSALNKLLIVLMAMSLRTMLTAMTVVERVANRIARIIMPDPTEDDEDV